MTPETDLVDRIDGALPQTQCTRCGYPDCRHYAVAIASGEAGIDRCPPGGQEGIERLARLTGQPVTTLAPDRGVEGPRRLAIVDETWCIGCTKCIDACPVDCIVGAPKQMHTVIEPLCTGCELCIPVCPVDCIALEDALPSPPVLTGWSAWSAAQADQARGRYAAKQARTARDQAEAEARLAALASSRWQRTRQARGTASPPVASDSHATTPSSEPQ